LPSFSGQILSDQYEGLDLLLKVGYAGATASLLASGLGAAQAPASFDALPLRGPHRV
jgi:hypothetical protein